MGGQSLVRRRFRTERDFLFSDLEGVNFEMVDSHLQALHCKNSVTLESRAPVVWQVWEPAGSEEGTQGDDVGTARAEK